MEKGLAWIKNNSTDLINLAQNIWEYAEIALKEQRSSDVLINFLKKEGFKITSGIGGMPTAFVASYGEGKPQIGFLGEFDALPGLSQDAVPYPKVREKGKNGHGCGHNLLGVGCLGAAVALKQEIQDGSLRGTVHYYGCPAEETAVGKIFMAREGVFDDLDAALTWHPDSLNMVNSATSLALNSVCFRFQGRSAHASGMPHLGISALDAVELMNTGVNYLREHVPADTRIHYVITNGGQEPNIVPSSAEVWYNVRAPHREDLENVYQRIINIADGACRMTGATFTIHFQTGLYNTLPNDVLSDLLEKSLLQVGASVFTKDEKEFARKIEETFPPGQKAAIVNLYHLPSGFCDVTLHEEVAPDLFKGELLWGSTDVGDVSWIVPTSQIITACYVLGTVPHSWQAAAAAGSSIGHKGMLTASRTLAYAGYQLMTQPKLLSEARQAFEKAKGKRNYISPLPPELKQPSLHPNEREIQT